MLFCYTLLQHLPVNSPLSSAGRGYEGGVLLCRSGNIYASAFLAISRIRFAVARLSPGPLLQGNWLNRSVFFFFTSRGWKNKTRAPQSESGKMMAPDPLRSATTIDAEDTSLALPSDRSLSSGRQRVLDQVHSIKRKSKHGKSVSSPTSTKTALTLNFFQNIVFFLLAVARLARFMRNLDRYRLDKSASQLHHNLQKKVSSTSVPMRVPSKVS